MYPSPAHMEKHPTLCTTWNDVRVEKNKISHFTCFFIFRINGKKFPIWNYTIIFSLWFIKIYSVISYIPPSVITITMKQSGLRFHQAWEQIKLIQITSNYKKASCAGVSLPIFKCPLHSPSPPAHHTNFIQNVLLSQSCVRASRIRHDLLFRISTPKTVKSFDREEIRTTTKFWDFRA